MKTIGTISVTSTNGAAHAAKAAALTTAVAPRGDIFDIIKALVRDSISPGLAFVYLELTNAFNSPNKLCMFNATAGAQANGVAAAWSVETGGLLHQNFVMEPDPITNDYKARGTWMLSNIGAALGEEDPRYILREVVLPRVVRQFEAPVPALEGGGTVEQETAPRLYTTLGLVAALQKTVENDVRFAGYKLGILIDENNHAVRTALIPDAEPQAQARGIAQANALDLDYIALAVTSDPAVQEVETAGEFIN